MGRAKNTELREKISRTAIQLFTEKGYVNTSFSDIAKACEVERSVIQYYFPYKDIFIREFLDRCLTMIAEMAEDLDEKRFDIFGKLYYMGRVSFEFLVESRQMQNLTTDIVASRELTEAMMPLYCQWDKWFMGDAFEEDGTMMAMGGAYELIYHYKKNGLPIDTELLTEHTYLVFAGWHGLNRKEAKNKLEGYILSEEELKKAVRAVEKELFYSERQK